MDPWPQVQDLIKCFPDEDEHLQKFCQWHPKSMLVKELVTMMQCPPSAEPWSVRVSAGVVAVVAGELHFLGVEGSKAICEGEC